jgi:DeoR/GlpR family transcriptional regulator of sugar metabolism
MARPRKSDRQRLILSELRMAPALRVQDLAQRLEVSTETVRRDLAELDDAGLIARTYGGAMRAVPHEPALAEREGLMVAERMRIAAAAATRVVPDDILMIGGGATTLHLARRLAAVGERLTVITHAPSIAQALAVNPGHRVLMLPGQYDGREGLIHGPDTVEALGRFRATTAFLGASGLTPEGPQDAAIGPAIIYGAMMRRASRSVIVADRTKFDRPSLLVYGPWSARLTLVTDTAPGGALAEAIRAAGAEIAIAPD